LFLLFVSNLEGVLEVLHQAGVGWDLSSGTSRFWSWLRIKDLLLPPAQPLSLVPKRFWWWWQASRVIQDIDLLGNVSPLSPIDEFPAFSFVLGDLHPHVLVMPFVMLLVGLSLAIFRGAMDGEVKILGVPLPYRLDLFVISAVTLGGIAFLNTWDVPVYFSLLTGAFLIYRVLSRGWSWVRVLDWIKLALPLGIVSILLYLPFFIGFQSQAGGILPNLVYPTRGIYVWLMFGSLLVPFFLFFIWLWRRKRPFEWRWGVILPLVLVFFLLLISISLSSGLSKTEWGTALISSQGKTGFLDFLGAALVHRLRYGFGLLTLTVLLILGLSSLLGFLRMDALKPTTSPLPFVLLMVLLGGLMVLGPEFLFLRDNFTARMNTIFKFYYQAWMLWSLAAGFAAVTLLKKAKWASQLIVIVMILLGLVYPALAFPDKTQNFSPVNGHTLDAAAYLVRYQENEAAAIGWLADAPDGVVAEAIGGQYSGYARVSTLSGQPTVLGWPGHEGQWRGGYTEVGNRETDVRNLYQAPDWETAELIIDTYNIRYIYVGGLERTAYAVSIEKFSENLPAGFEQGGVTVFVVP
jgi:YYY domain-containing protein